MLEISQYHIACTKNQLSKTSFALYFYVIWEFPDRIKYIISAVKKLGLTQ